MLLGSHEVSGGGKPAPRGAAKAAEVVVALPAGLVTKCVEGVLRFGAQKSMSGTSLLTVRRPRPAPRSRGTDSSLQQCNAAIRHVPQKTADFGLTRGRPLAADLHEPIIRTETRTEARLRTCARKRPSRTRVGNQHPPSTQICPKLWFENAVRVRMDFEKAPSEFTFFAVVLVPTLPRGLRIADFQHELRAHVRTLPSKQPV